MSSDNRTGGNDRKNVGHPHGQDSLPRRNTDPLWLQDYFLSTGHDADTRSGTATFVRRNGRHYVCTCRHILEGIKDPEVVPNANFPTLAFGVGGGFINLSRHTSDGLEQLIRAPLARTEHENTDIAIAAIAQSTWDMLVSKKRKVPIDLDQWKEPDWSKVAWGLANGYPDEHKKNLTIDDANGVADTVANQLITVVAELASKPHKESRTIILSSSVENPHTWYFSGLSGGPLYVVETLEERSAEDDELMPVGIVYEGFPSTGRLDEVEARDLAETFLTNKDLFIRAHVLTPEIFDEWLRDCGLS